MDRDNPYVLNVSKVINKYGIPKADLYGMPDLSLDKNQNIPEERTVVDAEALEQAIAKAQAEIDRDEAEQAKKEEARKEALTIGDNSKTEEAAAEKKEKEKKSRLVSAGVITAVLLVIISAVKAIAGKLSRKAGEDDESSED